jgi:hypothetical protein
LVENPLQVRRLVVVLLICGEIDLRTVPEPRHTPKMGGLRRLGTVMNRRKSVALSSGSSISGQEKKSRTGFSFRRGDSSRDVHTQLPSTPPGRDSPSIAGDSTASPPTTVSLRDPPILEESTGITPIQEAIETPVITNGTTANLANSQQAQTATAQVLSSPILPFIFLTLFSIATGRLGRLY